MWNIIIIFRPHISNRRDFSSRGTSNILYAMPPKQTLAAVPKSSASLPSAPRAPIPTRPAAPRSIQTTPSTKQVTPIPTRPVTPRSIQVTPIPKSSSPRSKLPYLVFGGILLLCVGTSVIIYSYSRGRDSTNPYTNQCSQNDDLSGWVMNDDNFCFYNGTQSTRRQLFVGSVYRSMSQAKFNGAYWALDDSTIVHNVLPNASINSSCTSLSTHPSCQMFFWEREVNGTVVDLTNPNGTSLLDFIQTRLETPPTIWEDLMQTGQYTGNLPDFCDSAINTDEAKGYIAQYPSVFNSLSAAGQNVYNASIESHRMLCNVVEYPYYPNTTIRGPADGSRLTNVSTVAIVNNTVYYTYGCNAGTGRRLSAHNYQPVYLVMLTQLYSKIISSIDYDVTFSYTAQNFSDYPPRTAIECEPL